MNEINIRLYTTILIDKQSVYLSLQTVYIDRQTDRQTLYLIRIVVYRLILILLIHYTFGLKSIDHGFSTLYVQDKHAVTL